MLHVIRSILLLDVMSHTVWFCFLILTLLVSLSSCQEVFPWEDDYPDPGEEGRPPPIVLPPPVIRPPPPPVVTAAPLPTETATWVYFPGFQRPSIAFQRPNSSPYVTGTASVGCRGQGSLLDTLLCFRLSLMGRR